MGMFFPVVERNITPLFTAERDTFPLPLQPAQAQSKSGNIGLLVSFYKLSFLFYGVSKKLILILQCVLIVDVQDWLIKRLLYRAPGAQQCIFSIFFSTLRFGHRKNIEPNASKAIKKEYKQHLVFMGFCCMNFPIICISSSSFHPIFKRRPESVSAINGRRKTAGSTVHSTARYNTDAIYMNMNLSNQLFLKEYNLCAFIYKLCWPKCHIG